MSDITIIGPDGSRFVFPAGTSRDVMLNAMRRRYTGQERREREQTRDMILNSQLPQPGRAGVREYLSRDQMRQDLAQAREANIAEQEAALIPEDTTRERFYTGAQGVTLGAAPLIQGAAVAPMAALLYPFLTDDMRADRSLGEFVSDMSGGAYQRARTDIARAREDRPIESLALETAGGLFTGKTAYDALGERFLRNRAAARGGVVGTGAGAQYGFLESEGDLGQTAQAAGMGGLFGAPVGKAIEGIADIGGRMFQRSRGMEAPETVAEPEPLPVPEPGRGYLGRRVFDNPPRPLNPRTEAERATWAPTASILEQARTRASEAKVFADQTMQSRRPEDIARVKDQKKALIADIEATMAQREGMNTPDDQRLADALSALSEPTNDPVFMSTQIGVAQRNLNQVMINQGMRPEPNRTPVQTVPPFRPTPSREQQARTISDRPSRTRYAEPPDETPMGFNANTAMQVGLGSAGGSVAGSTTDLNGDGVIDMQDVAIGSVMGGVGLPLAGRAASRLDNAFGIGRDVRGMGLSGNRKTPQYKAEPTSVNDSYRNELFAYKELKDVNGKPVAAADINILQSEKIISIRDIVTRPDAKRQGYATSLIEEIQKEFPDYKIEVTTMTDDGAAFFENTFNVNDQGIITGRKNSSVSSMGFGASEPPKPVQRAQAEGYQGTDTGESKEWLSAIRKGLRMDTESRMARAREMGFDTDTVLYHGTPDANFEEFNPSLAGASQRFKRGQALPGMSFAYGPGAASLYAGGANSSPAIIPVFAKAKNPLDLRNLGDFTDQSFWDKLRASGVQTKKTKPVSAEAGKDFETRIYEYLDAGGETLAKQIQAAGYDAIIFTEPASGQTFHIFDPSNIRSVYAAFDPEKSGSSELLAAVPFAVGGVGAGAAMQDDDQ